MLVRMQFICAFPLFKAMGMKGVGVHVAGG